MPKVFTVVTQIPCQACGTGKTTISKGLWNDEADGEEKSCSVVGWRAPKIECRFMPAS